MRAVFFGSSNFAVPSLRALAAHAHVALAVTQPPRPSGRGLRVTPTPVAAEALALGIPTAEPKRLRDVRELLEDARADVFALASYGKIVPQSILDMPRLGALNVHPSLLPLYRGATPLQSALRDGRAATGVTIILMDAGMDTGDVVLQERLAIAPDETYGALHDRCAALGAQLLVRAVDAAAAGTLARTPQDALGIDASEVASTRTRPLRKDDLVVDWHATARKVVDLVRSLAPEPAARATFAGETESVKILAARVAADRDIAAPGADDAGALHCDAAGAAVRCGDGWIVLERVVPPARKAMSGKEFSALRARMQRA
jgi:methionyl-tRNA formyltransferase